MAAAIGLITAMEAVCVGGVGAQTPQDYDFQWSTVGAVGNEPSPFAGQTFGRGRVDSTYRIS
jgi:hypothetical protein